MPKVDYVSSWFLEKFHYLSKSRELYFDLGGNQIIQPLKLSEIISLANAIGIIGPIEEFIYVIQSLDEKYRENVSQKLAKDQKIKQKNEEKEKESNKRNRRRR